MPGDAGNDARRIGTEWIAVMKVSKSHMSRSEKTSGANGRRLPATRKAELAAYVVDRGEVTVSQLASHFDVSPDTIRRDLDSLDHEGTLIRTHGGAVSPSGFPRPDSGMDLRLRVQADAKDTIGGLAAEMVEDNTSVMINSGTTALAMVRHLAGRRDLTIATNNLRIPGDLDPEIVRDLYVFGGSARLVSQATVGPVRLRMGIASEEVQVHADIAFIGVGAISSDGDLSTSNISEAVMMAEMIAAADRVVILADSSKFGRQLFARIAGFDEIDVIVSDKCPSASIVQKCAALGVELIFPA